jgi:S-methylmethionine-dependent homocysteine/selenocysteine methylase
MSTLFAVTPIPAKYRHNLPLSGDGIFLSDGGIETTLIYLEGLELPYFAAFDLLRTGDGRAALDHYYRTHASIARDHGTGFVLESATWRASADWSAKLNYAFADLVAINHQAIAMLHELRAELETPRTPMVISGCIGPRGDGYRADRRMTVVEAETYHTMQARVFAEAGADVVSAITMTYVEEAIGVVRAARGAGMPVVVSFTTETDGRLPGGQPLAEAVQQVDEATQAAPVYYMVNCAHPTHFADVLATGAAWTKRIGGLRANASRKSHAELDVATALDIGDPVELGEQYRALRRLLPGIKVLGGCCGTDHRHIQAISRACLRVK